jgi:hypothetical protein
VKETKRKSNISENGVHITFVLALLGLKKREDCVQWLTMHVEYCEDTTKSSRINILNTDSSKEVRSSATGLIQF